MDLDSSNRQKFHIFNKMPLFKKKLTVAKKYTISPRDRKEKLPLTSFTLCILFWLGSLSHLFICMVL
jgi:hypothetical protein